MHLKIKTNDLFEIEIENLASTLSMSIHLFPLTPIVPLHHQLMRPRDKIQLVSPIEFHGDVLSKGVSSPARGDSPPRPICRIRPQQVTHRPFMRDLLHAIQMADIIECLYGWGESSVQTEYLPYQSVSNSSFQRRKRKRKRKPVKIVGECSLS
jgi:hypothetical protein